MIDWSTLFRIEDFDSVEVFDNIYGTNPPSLNEAEQMCDAALLRLRAFLLQEKEWFIVRIAEYMLEPKSEDIMRNATLCFNSLFGVAEGKKEKK